jgi:acetylornithine deacetylase/succinyl-diaminopimelate desuccinylase-like protein
VAHRPDEYVELSQLESCARFLHRLVQATVAA